MHLSLGESMIRQPITPHALHPKPIHMVSCCAYILGSNTVLAVFGIRCSCKFKINRNTLVFYFPSFRFFIISLTNLNSFNQSKQQSLVQLTDMRKTVYPSFKIYICILFRLSHKAENLFLASAKSRLSFSYFARSL